MPRNDETHFRGKPIEQLVQDTGRQMKWQPADLITLYRHMSRYQITGKHNVGNGLDELARNLGISERSDYYKKPILDRAQSSILYHVKTKFRSTEYRVLVETSERARGQVIWKWPRYSLQWLRPDWSGDPYDIPDGEDPDAVRVDPPDQRATTPEPIGRHGGRRRPRDVDFTMSGALNSSSASSYRSPTGRSSIGTSSQTSARHTWTSAPSESYATPSRRSYVYSSRSPSSASSRRSDSTYIDSASSLSSTSGRGGFARMTRPVSPSSSLRSRTRTALDHESNYGDPWFDDEGHFSDSSNCTITPHTPRRRGGQRRQPPTYVQSPSHDTPSTQLDQRLNRTEIRMEYILNIVKMMVPWKRGVDEWRNDTERVRIEKLTPPTAEPSNIVLPDAPVDEPSYTQPPSVPPINPSQAGHYFPQIPPNIAAFDPLQGRLLKDYSQPPPPQAYAIPPGAEQTESQRLLSQAMMYATVELQHTFQASVAAIAGDSNEQHRQECGARVAGARRREAAQQALDAVVAERGGDNHVQIPSMLRNLLKKEDE